MEVRVVDDADALAREAADLVVPVVRDRPDALVLAATGETPMGTYAELAARRRRGAFDPSALRVAQLDEYAGIAADVWRTLLGWLRRDVAEPLGIDLRHTHLPDGVAVDLEKECADYERLITQAGGIDLQLLGIGRNGHLGFNEPLSAFRSRTRISTLSPETIEQNSGLFGGPENMPRRAITMGVGTILDGRRCVLLATGPDKAAILAQAVEGPITSMISATALQLHPHCTVIADEAAGSRLKKADYYRTIFNHDPKWEKFRQPAIHVNGRARPDSMQVAGN